MTLSLPSIRSFHASREPPTMTSPGHGRPHPFDLMFAGFRDTAFPAIHDALGEGDDVHAFLLAGPAIELLRDLRPDEGLGDGVDDFVALVHAAYLFWRDGEQTTALDEAATRRLVQPDPDRPRPGPLGEGPAQYIQVAPRLLWGQLAEAQPFEPLDGWFALRRPPELQVVACFGVHEQRPGLSVTAVDGGLPELRERPDGTRLFAPTMPGGDAADLHAVSVPAELLLLGWRVASNGGDTRWG